MLKDFGCEVELSAYDRPYTQTELMEVVGDVDAMHRFHGTLE